MMNSTAKRKLGRPELPPEERWAERLAMHTYTDAEEKARHVGVAAVEAAISKIKEPK